MLDFAWALYLAEKMLSDLLGYEKVLKADFVFCLLCTRCYFFKPLLSFTLAALLPVQQFGWHVARITVPITLK